MSELEQVAGQEGLFTGETTRAIEVDPTQIGMFRYAIPNTLGRAEPEELAARLVEAAVQNNGQWVGMSYRRLIDDLNGEINLSIANNRRKREAWEADYGGTWGQRVAKSVGRGLQSSGSRLGLTVAPTLASDQVKLEEVPYSVFTTMAMFRVGGPTLGNEIHRMADNGHLTIVEQGDAQILVPTPRMAETIYAAQERHREQRPAQG